MSVVNPSVETNPSVAEPTQATDIVDRERPKSTMSLINNKDSIAGKIALKARGKNSTGAGEVQIAFRVSRGGKSIKSR